jgi:hypothetical protein
MQRLLRSRVKNVQPRPWATPLRVCVKTTINRSLWSRLGFDRPENSKFYGAATQTLTVMVPKHLVEKGWGTDSLTVAVH